MKKLFTISILMILMHFSTFGQTVEITPFGGYVFATHWSGPNGTLRFDDAAMYGGSLSVGVNPVSNVSFTYTRIDTKARPDYSGYSFNQVALSQNYYMLGFTRNFPVNEHVSPFASINLGGVYFAPKETGYYNYWFFAMGADAGAKIYFNDVIGIRLQAQLMFPVQYGGFSFYFGTGGSGTSVNVSSTMVDFGFTGGLIFRLGKK
jgi:hypothetical protein